VFIAYIFAYNVRQHPQEAIHEEKINLVSHFMEILPAQVNHSRLIFILARFEIQADSPLKPNLGMIYLGWFLTS